MSMNIIESRPQWRAWVMALALGALVAGCNKDAILGSNGIAALVPAVTAVTPLSGATGVLTNSIVTATLNEPVAPMTGTASMTVTCAAPCVNATGTVTLDATHTVATFTLTPGTALATATLYTGKITGATALSSGTAMARPYTWQFPTVGTPPALTRPQVPVTAPATTVPGPTAGAPSNTAISATFTKNMAPATITGASFTVTCTAPCVSPTGTVNYSVGARTVVFRP